LDNKLLLVTDLSMPGMDGMALIRAARRQHPELPAILLSGHAPALANSATNPFSPGDRGGQSDHLPGLRHVVWLQKPVTLAHLREVTAMLMADGVLA
jgi:CheY-like chemotaxis protein